jgi:hypothetical protein
MISREKIKTSTKNQIENFFFIINSMTVLEKTFIEQTTCDKHNLLKLMEQ